MRFVGLIGLGLKHSISPQFQQAAFDHLGLDVRYELWDTEESDLPGHRANTLVTLGPWSSQNWKASVQCRLRGLYHLGEVTVTASDPFGIFSRQNTVGERHELLVYPATVVAAIAVDTPGVKADSTRSPPVLVIRPIQRPIPTINHPNACTCPAATHRVR